jgi:flagellar assembly factor FliW
MTRTNSSTVSVSAESHEPAVERNVSAQEIVSFPYGLPGFEGCRSFVVFAADAAPFQWLTSVEGPEASFLTVDPRLVLPNFRYVLSPSDLKRLGATEDTPLLWLAIVLLEADGAMTANLRAPIVINPETMVGQQVMPQDCVYPLRHPIVSAAD